MEMTPYELLVAFCNFLSYTVLMVTCIYKAPQVYAVVSSGSSLGISLPSLILEFTSYTIESSYQFGMGYAFDTYFETTLMWAQDVILFWVVLSNRHLLNCKLFPYITVYAVGATFIANRWLPDIIMYSLIYSDDFTKHKKRGRSYLLLVSKCSTITKILVKFSATFGEGSTTPIICSSKIVQLVKILKTKNPGSLSALTWGLLSYLAGARVLTAIVITGDIPMFFNNFFATFLDIWVSVSIVYYNRLKMKRRSSR